MPTKELRSSLGSELDECFPKEQRLRKRSEFLLVQGLGRKIHCKDLLAFFYPGGARRLGVTVSRRVGGAVVRNRIKRCLREAWRRNKRWLTPRADIVLIAKRSAAAASYGELEEQLRQIGRKVGNGHQG